MSTLFSTKTSWSYLSILYFLWSSIQPLASSHVDIRLQGTPTSSKTQQKNMFFFRWSLPQCFNSLAPTFGLSAFSSFTSQWQIFSPLTACMQVRKIRCYLEHFCCIRNIFFGTGTYLFQKKWKSQTKRPNFSRPKSTEDGITMNTFTPLLYPPFWASPMNLRACYVFHVAL